MLTIILAIIIIVLTIYIIGWVYKTDEKFSAMNYRLNEMDRRLKAADDHYWRTIQRHFEYDGHN